MHSSSLFSALAIPVTSHHATSPVSWGVLALIAGNVAALIAISVVGFWGFRLGSRHEGGNGPGGGGARRPHPQPPPSPGGRRPVSEGLSDVDLRDFNAWESEMESAATPKRRDPEKVPAGTRLGILIFRPHGAGRGAPSRSFWRLIHPTSWCISGGAFPTPS